MSDDGYNYVRHIDRQVTAIEPFIRWAIERGLMASCDRAAIIVEYLGERAKTEAEALARLTMKDTPKRSL
jgi:hypothetical protein